MICNGASQFQACSGLNHHYAVIAIQKIYDLKIQARGMGI